MMDKYTFGNNQAAQEMSEVLNQFENKNFKKAYVRAVQNFDGHLVSLLYSQMDNHSKAYFLEQVLPNVITSFNNIRNNYRGRKNSFHMNKACGKAVVHFRFKINQVRKTILTQIPFPV